MSRSRGARNISRLLKRLPDEVSREMVVEMNIVGREIAAEMRGRTPYRTGALKAGISYKVLPKSLKLQVGLLGTPTGRAKLYYGRILDLGRKAKVVQGHRRSKSGAVTTYAINIRAIPGLHFVTGRFTELRNKMKSNLSDIWTRSITQAAAGGGDE